MPCLCCKHEPRGLQSQRSSSRSIPENTIPIHLSLDAAVYIGIGRASDEFDRSRTICIGSSGLSTADLRNIRTNTRFVATHLTGSVLVYLPCYRFASDIRQEPLLFTTHCLDIENISKEKSTDPQVLPAQYLSISPDTSNRNLQLLKVVIVIRPHHASWKSVCHG